MGNHLMRNMHVFDRVAEHGTVLIRTVSSFRNRTLQVLSESRIPTDKSTGSGGF